MRAADRRARRAPGRHDRGARQRRAAASAAARLGRAPGAAMRLLPERHADGRGCAAGEEPRAERRRDRRRDHQPLPLRHLPALARGHPKPPRPLPSQDERGAPTARSSAASARPARWWSAGACCRRAARLGAVDALPVEAGEVEPERLDQDRRRRHRDAGDEPQRDGPGHAHRARHAGRRGARRAAGARAPASRRAPTGSTATSRRWSPACRTSIRARPSRARRRRRRRPGNGSSPRSRASSASTSPAARRASSTPGRCCRLAAATARARLLGAASIALEAAGGASSSSVTASSATPRAARRTTASWRAWPRRRRPARCA